VKKRIAVIGGGWAGCAASITLARAGHRVSLFEASRTLGGRARHVEVNGLGLDNGQHIMLGAYSATLESMRLVGIRPEKVLLRLPLQMRYPPESGGMDFVTPRLPAPLHMLAGLFRASGLNRDDKMSLARFSTTAKWMGWTLNIDCTVTELLERFDQTDRLIQLMWRPLCIAALNTPPERASARVFLHVLRDSIGAGRAASDMLIPRVDLSELFPRRAGAFIEQHGGQVELGTAIKTIGKDASAWRLTVSGKPSPEETPFDAVIIATHATQANELLAGVPGSAALPDFQYEPITTCYLYYGGNDDVMRDAGIAGHAPGVPHAMLSQPFFALIDDPARGHWGQFVFDRGQLDEAQKGLLAVVVSASAEAIALGHQALASAVAAQLAQVFQREDLSKPAWTKVISEKRATFSCTPGLERPGPDTGNKGLFVAGDYTASDYPATLESAVRSGIEAAGLAMQSFRV
jgi:hydroxysqualene dehydroxylase